MGLGDVMGAMRLEWFAEIGLALSLSGFAAALVAVWRRGNRAAFERARRLPLEGDGGDE